MVNNLRSIILFSINGKLHVVGSYLHLSKNRTDPVVYSRHTDYQSTFLYLLLEWNNLISDACNSQNAVKYFAQLHNINFKVDVLYRIAIKLSCCRLTRTESKLHKLSYNIIDVLAIAITFTFTLLLLIFMLVDTIIHHSLLYFNFSKLELDDR